MATHVLSIGNEFLDLSEKDGIQISQMKLLKLVYFAHGFYYAKEDKPLIDNEVMAWPYGPVIIELYDAFKVFGSEPITRKAYTPRQPEDPMFELVNGREVTVPTDPSLKHFLKEIWDALKVKSAKYLSDLTHVEGSPWEQAWSKRPCESKSVLIPESTIREYFRGLKRND